MNDNPTAMITGASRGLGLALAAGLAREGFALIIDARNAAALDAAAGRSGPRAGPSPPSPATSPTPRTAPPCGRPPAPRVGLTCS